MPVHSRFRSQGRSHLFRISFAYQSFRPTEAQRQQILKQGAEAAESAKQQIRLARTDGLKALGGRDQDGSKEVGS
jgi:ribosome recycling factor